MLERIHTWTLYLCLFYGSYSYNDEAFTAWVNRFANAGDAAMEIAGNTALRVSYWSFLFLFTELHLTYPIFPKCFHISLYLLFCKNNEPTVLWKWRNPWKIDDLLKWLFGLYTCSFISSSFLRWDLISSLRWDLGLRNWILLVVVLYAYGFFPVRLRKTSQWNMKTTC